MDEKPPYPRYFAYGTIYLPPAPYIRVDNERESHIVDPGGHSMLAHFGTEYWEHRERQGAMVETTREVIAELIDRWNKFNMAKLKPPE